MVGVVPFRKFSPVTSLCVSGISFGFFEVLVLYYFPDVRSLALDAVNYYFRPVWENVVDGELREYRFTDAELSLHNLRR